MRSILLTSLLFTAACSNDPAGDVVNDPGAQAGMRVVGYWDNWSLYNSKTLKSVNSSNEFSISDYFANNPIQAAGITHINYAFAKFGPDNTIALTDSYADTGFENDWNKEKCVGRDSDKTQYQGMLCQMTRLKNKGSKFKALISLGGWGSPEHQRISLLNSFHDISVPANSGDQTTFNTFADSVVDMLKKYNLDGLDIDWEYPWVSQDGATKIQATNAETEANFICKLKDVLKKDVGEDVLLTLSASADPTKAGWPNWKKMVGDGCVDFVNLMTYDYYGAAFPANLKTDNSVVTAVNAPLKDNSKLAKSNWSVTSSIQTFVSEFQKAGVSPEKLSLGLAFYGRSMQQDASKMGLNLSCVEEGTSLCKAGPQEVSGQYGGWTGSMKYWMLNQCFISNSDCTTRKDFDGTPYLTCKTGKENCAEVNAKVYMSDSDAVPFFAGYDDESSIAAKVDLAKASGLGGVMMWTLTGDDNGAPLMKAALNALEDN